MFVIFEKNKKIEQALTILKFFTHFIPLVAFFFVKEKVAFKRYIFFYALFCIFNTAGLIFLNFYYPFKPLFYALSVSYTPFEFVIFSLIFLKIFTTNTNKRIILIGIPFFLILWGILLGTTHQENFDSIAVALEEILLIGYALLYYFERISNIDSVFLYATPEFWVVAAILIYAAATFFVYLYADSYLGSGNFKQQYDMIHLIASIAKNILFTIALLTHQKKNLLATFQQKLT